MKGVYETMEKIMKSNIVRGVGIVLALVCIVLFTSFTTQKTVTDSVKDYAAYQFRESIRAVLSEDVVPKLDQNAEAIARLEGVTAALVDGTYSEMVRNITKYYEKYEKGDVGDLTRTNFDAMAGWWKVLPDSRKTDSLRMKYETLMAYYPKLK